jgi:hypothetical protein
MRELRELGVHGAAIMSNAVTAYPDDAFDKMQEAAAHFRYPFPYLYDESQAIARAYGAVCTPDFFGFSCDYRLQYRGRLDAGGRDPRPGPVRRELVDAMREVAESGAGPREQTASIGCSIKWK